MSEKKDPFFRTMIEEFNMNKMCRTTNQSGRSMIEMLGVLAIIGVLSVGGIAGYSKAMMKFKINKTIDQISQIVANTRTLYARQKNYGNLSGKILYKANLAPKEMFDDGSGSYSMTNPFGGHVTVKAATKNKSAYDNKAFIVSFYDIPEEACIELATQDWGSDTSSGLIAISAAANGLSSYIEASVGINDCQGGTTYLNYGGLAYACPGGSNVSIPMPVDRVIDVCSGSGNSIHLKYY